MSTKVTIQWCDPEHDWELVETTVGDGETHITEVCTSVTTLAAAERMAKYIKAHWDVFDRAPGTAPTTMTFTPQEFGLLDICSVEDIQIGMVVTFSPGGVNVRLLDATVTADDKLTLTFEVLK